MLTAVTLDDARVRKISPAMPIKLRKHSANLLQQQQQQQHGELRRQVLSPESLDLGTGPCSFLSPYFDNCAVLNIYIVFYRPIIINHRHPQGACHDVTSDVDDQGRAPSACSI